MLPFGCGLLTKSSNLFDFVPSMKRNEGISLIATTWFVKRGTQEEHARIPSSWSHFKDDIEGQGSPLRRSCGLHCLIRKSLAWATDIPVTSMVPSH
ncbi:hypothetical protein V1477_018287 [Vespula maculifrons]|uniref:Uncharacterized protein n=2 Tax=Vespula TaxID=7451 RepID=A0A834KTK4_VESVU|nr:hypothetical protein HZH66_001524 [Vespula vulgaris]